MSLPKGTSGASRSDFVLSTTITETILLLFLLLLLLLTYFVDRSNSEQATLRRALDQKAQEALAERTGCLAVRAELNILKQRLEPFLDRVPSDKKAETRRVLVALSQLEALLASEQHSVKTLQQEVTALKEVASKLRADLPQDAAMESAVRDAMEKQRCAQLRTESNEMRVRNRELDQLRATEQRLLSDAHKRNQEMQERYKRLAERAGRGGDEYVACWKSGDEIEYVFAVHLSQGQIRVERKWPEQRAREMEKFSAERGLVGRTVSLQEFLTSTADMFADSKRLACRHFVDIVGKRVEMDKANFTNYQGIQNHFYKRDSVK